MQFDDHPSIKIINENMPEIEDFEFRRVTNIDIKENINSLIKDD